MNTKDGYAKKSLTSARLLTADGGDTDNYLPLTGGTMTGALVTTALSVSGAATFSQAINGNILGNAATASRLQNARTISLTGSVTGSGSFDGSGNLSITTTTNHNHNYITSTGFSNSGSTSLSTWGTLKTANGYTGILNIGDSNGGSWEIAYKEGKQYHQIDGYYYQNEGAYRVLDTSDTLNSLSGVSISNPTTGQVLKYNGTNWVNDTDNAGSGGDGNTWRGIYTDGISRIGTDINTKAVNFVAGDNMSITYIQAGTTNTSNYSGSNDYFNIKFSCISQQWFKIYKNSNSAGSITYTYPNWINFVGMSSSYPQYCYYDMRFDDKFLCFTIEQNNTQSDEVLVGFGSFSGNPGDTYTRQVMFDFHNSKVYKKIGSTVTQIRESFSQGPYILKISGTTAYFYLNKTLLSTETLSNIPSSIIIHSNINSSVNIYINDFGMLQPLIIDDLYNTLIYNPSQGQVLKYTSQSGLWGNSADETSSGGGSVTGITTLGNGYWSGSVSGTTGTYAPFTSRQNSACFYTGTTDPNGATRLNYNGYLYATKLYSNGTEVSVEGHSHSYAAVSHNHSGHDLVPNSITLGSTSGNTNNLYIGSDKFDFRRGTTMQFELTLQNGNTSADDILSIKSSNNTTNLSLGLSTIVVTSDNYTNYLSGSGATALTGLSDVLISSPSNGQVLKYNGSKWVNGSDNTSSGTSYTTLSTSAHSSSSSYVIKGSGYSGTGNGSKFLREDGTWQTISEGTSYNALSSSAHAAGTNYVIPGSGYSGTASKFLREDGTWQIVSGGGSASQATSWAELGSGTNGTSQPTLFVSDPFPNSGASADNLPDCLYYPGSDKYCALPVIIDSNGQLFVAISSSLAQLVEEDGWRSISSER